MTQQSEWTGLCSVSSFPLVSRIPLALFATAVCSLGKVDLHSEALGPSPEGLPAPIDDARFTDKQPVHVES